MKKLFVFLCALALTLGLKAQCPYTEARDFTVTDIHGTEVHLFDILDNGQAVLIDFFFTTCSPCQQSTPNIVQSYYSMGCNMHDVFYMEIANGDTDAACLNWVNTYGVEYPTISGVGGGSSICSQYGIGAFPTVILIMPNHQIVIQDLWPISNAQTVISSLEGQGLEQHDCNAPAYDPQVTVTIEEVFATSATVSFTPNADCAAFYYDLMTEAEMQAQIDATGLDVAHILRNFGFGSQEATSQVFYGLEPDTEYYVWVVPSDINGDLYEVQQVLVEYVPGPGEIMPDFTAIDIDGNEIHLYDILDAGQAVLINFFLRDEFSPLIMPYVTEAYRLYGCNQHDVFFMEINPQSQDDACREWVETYGVDYPTISRDGGGNDIVQSIPVAYYPTVMIIRPDHTYAVRDLYPIENTQTIVNALNAEGYEQHECSGVGIAEDDNTAISIFPNPANDFVTLKGENLGTVSVYNTLGQKVDEFETNGNELRIATNHYSEGVYVVRADGQTLRFVVTH